MTRTLIISAVRLYREGIAQALGHHSGMVVVGTKAAAEGATAEIQALQPDVVVVDMVGRDGLATLRLLKRTIPKVVLVGLGVPSPEEDVLAVMEAGASGWVTQDATLDDLANVVESTARGELRCSPRIAGILLRRLSALTTHPHPPAARLTNREAEIVLLIDQDLSNKEIAARLGIEVATVKNHVHNLFEKLNVHRRTEAVRLVSCMTSAVVS